MLSQVPWRFKRNVVKPNDIDVFAASMLRELEEVGDALETARSRKIGSNVVARDLNDRIDLDLALLHSISLACRYARPMPYANAASDRTRSDTVAQILCEEHSASLAAYLQQR